MGRPDIQAFVDVIAGCDCKGLFVTTAKFSRQAREYAERQHIVLIDGQKLAELMIEHDFGVSTRKDTRRRRSMSICSTGIWRSNPVIQDG